MGQELMKGCSPGVVGTVSKTGWSIGEIFQTYLEDHFVKFVQSRNPSQPLLLRQGGHRSHIFLGLINWTQELNIIRFVLTANTTHALEQLMLGDFAHIIAFMMLKSASTKEQATSRPSAD